MKFKTIVLFLCSVILPFIVSVKGSVYFYESHQLPTYISILLGLVSAIIINTVLIMYWFKSYNINPKNTFKVSFIIMLLFVGYGTFMLRDSNAKSTSVKDEFYSLHPILRLGVGGLSILDQNLVVTDMKRDVKDYDGMGLKRNSNSLHLMQSTGYVHAVDLRTNGRFFLWNWIVQSYFWICGFDTLRHVGNADHLHISLRP